MSINEPNEILEPTLKKYFMEKARKEKYERDR